LPFTSTQNVSGAGGHQFRTATTIRANGFSFGSSSNNFHPRSRIRPLSRVSPYLRDCFFIVAHIEIKLFHRADRGPQPDGGMS